MLEISMHRAAGAHRHQGFWKRPVLSLQRPDRGEPINTVAIDGVGLQDKNAGRSARDYSDIRVRPFAEVSANFLGIGGFAPLGAAVFLRLVRLLLSGRRGEYPPATLRIFQRSVAHGAFALTLGNLQVDGVLDIGGIGRRARMMPADVIEFGIHRTTP